MHNPCTTHAGFVGEGSDVVMKHSPSQNEAHKDGHHDEDEMILLPEDLLAKAINAGLAVSTRGDQLVVRGPNDAEPLVRLLLARKPELMRLLNGELKKPVVVPSGAKCYFQNDKGQPCAVNDAKLWTFEGGTCWYPIADYPYLNRRG